MLQILDTIGITISSYEIVAVHRIGKSNSRYPTQTIVRFTNRKVISFCMEHRGRLKECRSTLQMNLRFYENLCEQNEIVRKYCYKLKRDGHIQDYFSRNGFIKIIVEDGDRPFKIRHPELLIEKFDFLED